MMAKIRNRILIGTAAVVAAVAIYASFFIGRQSAQKQFAAQRDYNVQLNKSDLNVFDKAQGKIYVTGHKSPDSDTVGCAFGYASLLRRLGYDAEPVLLEPINNESKFILEQAKLEVPPILENAAGLNLVLVDHSEWSQSAHGLKKANILAVIDHHAIGSISTGELAVYDGRPLGSAATIVWIRHRNYGLVPEKQVAVAMLGSVLSDTRKLTAVNTTFADREAAKNLARIGGVTDIDAFYKGMFQASLSYDDLSDEQVWRRDYKEFERGGKKFAIGCLNAYDREAAKQLAARVQNVFPAALDERGMELGFLQIDVVHDDVSCSYYMGANEESDKILKQIFKDEPNAFDGLFYKHEPFASRKFFAVPQVTKILEEKE